MATLEMTEQNFDSTVDRGIVLIDWWAAWCGPCRAFAPTFEAASERHPDIVFGKVDTDAQRRLAGGFGIRAIPTLMAFRDGILVFAQPGVLPAPVLEELIGKVRALDMDAVRKELADAEAKQARADTGAAHEADAASED